MGGSDLRTKEKLEEITLNLSLFDSTKKEMAKAIRRFCVACCGGVDRGINGPDGCNSTGCPLWIYRCGKDRMKEEAKELQRIADDLRKEVDNGN